MTPPAALCASCRFARRIENRRGSAFWLCRRSDDDPRFPRYPKLPVLACPGHEPQHPGGTEEEGAPDGSGGRLRGSRG